MRVVSPQKQLAMVVNLQTIEERDGSDRYHLHVFKTNYFPIELDRSFVLNWGLRANLK